MRIILQNAVFYISYFLFSLIYIPVAFILVTPAAAFLSRKALLGVIRKCIHYYGAVTARLTWPWIRIEIKNRSSLQPKEPCLFISNHQSIADPYLMGLFPNDVVFISNRWPFSIPVLGFFAKLAGYLNAQDNDLDTLFIDAQQRLKEGVSIVSFPEGTRTRNGQLGSFHSTAFRLAQQAHIPIVPFCISGLYDIIPPGQALLKPGRIRIHTLAAIHPADYEHLTPHQLKQKVRQIIANELAVLKGVTACN